MAKEPPQYPYGVRLTVAYDGTDFHGWQAQPRVRTVQETIEGAIDALGVGHSRVRGCSRTDAGVHALGQVAACGVDQELPLTAWTVGLNGLLPEDVVVTSAGFVDRRYDPRHDSQHKLYRYLIRGGHVRDPSTRRIAWHLGGRMGRRDLPRGEDGHVLRRPTIEDYLDLDRMRDAASRLVGEHDFHAFRAMSDDREQTVRKMHSIEILPGFGGRADSLAIEIRGNAFMKNMVRIFAGTLVDVGRGRTEPEHMDWLLSDQGSRHQSGPTAPAHGLTLVEIVLGRGDHKKAAVKS